MLRLTTKTRIVAKSSIHRRRLTGRTRFACILVCLAAFGSLATAALAAAQDAPTPTAPHKILFLGNSITKHGPAPAIGWLGDWGMAASAEDKDFVHLLTRDLTKSPAAAPKILVNNIADFERQYATYDVDANLKDAFDFKPDLVIVAIGENVPNLASEQAKTQFTAAMRKLLARLKSDGQPTIVVRSCFWPNEPKDTILRQTCQEVGGIFVDISALCKDEGNYGRSERKIEHAGVGSHPGDKGMQGIADAILAALKEHEKKAAK